MILLWCFIGLLKLHYKWSLFRKEQHRVFRHKKQLHRFGMTGGWVNNARNDIFGSIVPLKRPHLCFVFPAGTSMMWKRVKRYLDALFRSVARTLMSTAGLCQPRALPAFTTSSSPVCFWLRGWKWSKGQWCFHGNNLSRHMCVWFVLPLWCPFPHVTAHTHKQTHTCTYFNHVFLSL